MGAGLQDVGRGSNLFKRARKLLVSAATVAAIGLGLWGGGAQTIAGGETRTLSLFHSHTKERLTVTYMVNGKYVPSAMKKINYFLRDWRRNEVITIDPRTIDLMWELHTDLGSKVPIGIVSGYRSPRTNAFLKRIGRNVARKSKHMKGKAIDIFFPDVNTKTMRNSALVRQVGGVGYYRSGGGPSGFLHIDSGNVRHWGPGISRKEMASIFSKFKKTVGARLTAKDRVVVATRENAKSKALVDGPSIYDGVGDEVDAKARAQMDKLLANSADDEDAVDNAGDNATDSAAAVADAAAQSQEQVAEPAVVASSAVPKPRPKPIEVLMMAAANMQIEPANAPPPTQISRKRSVSNGVALASVEAPSIDDAIDSAADGEGDPMAVQSGKGSFGEFAKAKPLTHKMRPVVASVGESDINWWPQSQDGNSSAEGMNSIVPEAVPAAQSEPELAVIEENGTSGDGKGDMLVIDRTGKGSLPAPLPALIKG